VSAFDVRTISDREAAAKLVKIGVADCILARYDRISSLSPLPLRIAGAVASTQAAVLEQGFHEEFDELRSHGEWFHLEGDLARSIKSLSKSKKDKLYKLPMWRDPMGDPYLLPDGPEW